MKKITVGILLFLSLGLSADTKFIPILDVDARAAYTNLSGVDSSFSGNAWLFAMPAFKFEERDYLLPVYNFSFSTSEKVIEEETLFARRMNNLLSIGYKHKFSKELDIKTSIDGRYNFNMETKDEILGKGLYDLWDIGSAILANYNTFLEDKPYPISLGFKYYQRKYPNYNSLASTSTSSSTITIDKEIKPKDFNAVNISSGWKTKYFGIYSDLSYNLLIKNYLDAYTRTNQGLISDTKRLDVAHYIDLGLVLPVEGMVIGSDINFTYYCSNGSIYDTNKLEYTGDYYTYLSASLKPSVSFAAGDLSLSPYYSFLIRNYKERKARDANGNYLSDKQLDFEHTLGVGAKYPIMKSLFLVGGISYFASISNQKYEQYIRYTFNILNASVGISYSY